VGAGDGVDDAGAGTGDLHPVHRAPGRLRRTSEPFSCRTLVEPVSAPITLRMIISVTRVRTCTIWAPETVEPTSTPSTSSRLIVRCSRSWMIGGGADDLQPDSLNHQGVQRRDCGRHAGDHRRGC
jgi:hypothetical protein